MSDQYLGEIRPVGFNFAPVGWATCDGQIIPISQNTALFSLLGTSYGGNGTSNFALPNLQGNVAVNMGQGAGLSEYSIGQTGGSAAVALTVAEMGPHSHQAQAVSGRIGGDQASPNGNAWAKSNAGDTPYATSSNTTLTAGSTSGAGGSQPHNNLMPYQVILFVIALQGIYPPRS